MAGTIDQLNFEVILKDEKFAQQIEKDIARAKELNESLNKLLSLKKTLDSDTTKSLVNAEKVAQAAAKTAEAKAKQALAEQKVRTEEEKAAAAARSHSNSVSATNDKLYSMARILRTVSTLTGAAFSVHGIRRFLSSLIDITGQFEVQRTALRNMLQDVDAADKIFQDLYRFSSDSTYRFSELAKYAKQLAAFNIGKDNLLETTKMLGDVASGVGVSMDRLILAYGHVKSSGFLRGIQLRSFSQNGVPILEELSKMFTEIEGKAVSLGDVFDKMMKREIPFEMVEEAFKRMTSEGGQFYQMQEVLAKTLAGQINILKGRWENLLAAIGQANSGVLKDAVGWMSNLVSSMDNIGRLVTSLVVGFGAYQVALFTVTALTSTLSNAMNVGLVGAMKNVIKQMIAMATANPYVALAAAIGVASVALYNLATRMSETEKMQKVVDKATNDYNASLATEIAELDRLVTKIKLCEEGTNDYNAARQALETRFGPYLQELRNEGRAVTDLAETYELLRGKIEASMRARFLESGSQDLKSQLDASTKIINDQVEKTLGQIGKNLSASQQEILSSYVFGLIDENNPALANLQNKLVQGRGEGGPLAVGYRSLASLREEYSRVLSTYNAGMAKIEERFKTLNEMSGENGAPGGENYYDIKSIVAGIKAYDDEIAKITAKAAAGRITEDEKNKLTQLREARKEQADLYKEIMGVDYDKSVGGANKTPKVPQLSLLQKAEIAMMEEADDWIEKDFKEQTKELEKALNERIKAFDDYEKFYSDWSRTDFGKHGEGALFDISSLLVDYHNKDKAADDKFTKGVELAKKAHEGNAKAIEAETKKLRGLRDLQKEMNKTEFVEKVRGKAGDIFREGMAGYDLTNWSDKTFSQILAIRDAMKKLDLPDDVRKELEGDTEAAQALQEAFNKLKEDTIRNTVDPEMFKKVAKESKRLAGHLGTAAQKMRDLADATGNTSLSEAAEVVGMLAQNMQAAADGAESWGGWWGAIIGGLTDMLDQAVTGLTDSAQKARELAATIREIRDDAWIASNTSLFSKGGIFGENGGENLRGAVEAMDRIRKDMEVIGDPKITRNGMSFWDKLSVGWRIMYNSGHIAPEEFMSQGTLSEVMQKYGLNMYDENGILDPQSIRKVIEMFGDTDGVLERLAKDAEAYAEAMKVVEDTAESIVGGVVGDLADKIVDSWWEAGNAALDYADILEDVAKGYAKLIVQDMLLDAAFDEQRQEAFKDALKSGDVARAMAIVEQGMQAAQDMLPAVEQAMTVFEPYRNMGGGESNSVGSGIKGITEQTANLLASYINAIRADVSSIRLLQERGWAAVGIIGTSFPTLTDYMNQVAANTYDAAQNTNRILSELQSVIGPAGTSGSVVRVEAYR